MVHAAEFERVKMPDEADRMAIGHRLKIVRIALDKTPVQIAELIGMARQTYTQWEGGTNVPDRDLAIIYVSLVPGLSMDYIYFGRKQGLGKEMRGSIDILDKLDERSLSDIDPKKTRRRKI